MNPLRLPPEQGSEQQQHRRTIVPGKASHSAQSATDCVEVAGVVVQQEIVTMGMRESHVKLSWSTVSCLDLAYSVMVVSYEERTKLFDTRVGDRGDAGDGDKHSLARFKLFEESRRILLYNNCLDGELESMQLREISQMK